MLHTASTVKVTDYPDGIPKGEFERLIMEYLPVTAEEIQDYAAFDKEKQTYAWVRLDFIIIFIIFIAPYPFFFQR